MATKGKPIRKGEIKKGDLIFTGTPAGVGPIEIGQKLTAYIENEKLLECEVR